MSISIRLAQPADIPALTDLIRRSASTLSSEFYTPQQVTAAIRYVFGVDSTLIEDGTYFAALDEAEIVGCGGWSYRRTLYGGDQRPIGSADQLDPATEAARIRAFFVDPPHARLGIGRLLLDRSTRAAGAAGFRRLELMATLPGVPLYVACGFRDAEHITDILPDGTALDLVRMTRAIEREHQLTPSDTTGGPTT